MSVVKEKIHVIHMVPLGAGGITSMVLNIAEELCGTDIKIDYLTFCERTEFNEARALGYGGKKYVVPTNHYKNMLIRAIYKFLKTISVLKECGADIIHINASFPYDIMVGVSAKLAGMRVVFHSHNSGMNRENLLKRRIMSAFKWLIPLVSDQNIACSELAAQFMLPEKIIRNKEYVVLHNGIHSGKYQFNIQLRQKIRKELHLENKIVVGHVGRFTAQKNHEFLLDIYAQIHTRCPESILLLIGEGELLSEVKRKAESYGMQQNIVFYGVTQNISAMYQIMDCFLMPSLYEGLPFAAIEAQAAGLMCFFSDSISKEVAVTELAHFLPLKLSAESWAEEVLNTISNAKVRVSCQDQIKERGYEIMDMVEQLKELYREVMNL